MLAAFDAFVSARYSVRPRLYAAPGRARAAADDAAVAIEAETSA
jgi:hypothetical protein